MKQENTNTNIEEVFKKWMNIHGTKMETLINASEKLELIIIAGSGVSKSAVRKKIPAEVVCWSSWKELLENAFKFVEVYKGDDNFHYFQDDGNLVKKYIENGHYLRAASFIGKMFGDKPPYSGFKDWIMQNATVNDLSNYNVRQQKLLIELSKERMLITTNYDNLFELTLDKYFKKIKYQVYTNVEVMKMINNIKKTDQFQLFKAHGSNDTKDVNAIIVDQEDYSKLIYQNPSYILFMQSIFLHYTVLFVGFSLDDPDFRHTLSILGATIGFERSMDYALLYDCECRTKSEIKILEQQYCIKCIPITTDDLCSKIDQNNTLDHLKTELQIRILEELVKNKSKISKQKK